MTRSPSVEQPQFQHQQQTSKPSKRKGTRSVSTLTPSQLARKRANDREAQRAIRARTKEHIERLERELEELKSRHSRDETVQDLLKRNKALERELMALRESLGIQGRQYPNQVYEDGGSGAPSRPSSYGRSSEYGSSSNFGPSYLPTPEPCESWSSVVPVSAVSVPSVVSSPSSSAANEEYVPGYIPTSVPPNMMENNAIPPPAIQCIEGGKMEYNDMEHQERGNYSQSHHHSPPGYLHQSWPPAPTQHMYTEDLATRRDQTERSIIPSSVHLAW
ncbi:hypothetical protein P8C59_002931 [Phyllachora maydis]|uniref:BZIP transcription factor n=1 Tax=Phyllachora maydis TaxID=1825666 RepID=A0AAD9HZ81_9PEZI|nr:hypothetical protein P8C59_002931 [Phyllachora maydis]